MAAMDDPKSDSQHRELLEALRAYAETAERVVDQRGAAIGVRRNDLRTLSLITRRQVAGLDTTPSEIARHLRLTTAATTALIDRMVAHGHARREPSTSDRRSIRVVATENALREGQGIFLPIAQRTVESLSSFSTEEIRIALQVVTTATAALESVIADDQRLDS